MHPMSNSRVSSFLSMERLPWPIRALLGGATATLAFALTYWIGPLRAFPLLLAFPTVILSAWFLGMWGGIACAFTDAVLVDHFLTSSQLRFSIANNVPEDLRLSLFVGLSILLAWTIRRSALRRAQLETQELQQSLALANVERQIAEERARASETLRDRDEVLQIALRANGMGLWAWDLKLGTLHWSDEVYRIVGREPGSMEPDFEAWLRLVHPEDVTAVREGIRQTQKDGRDYHRLYRVLLPDGSVRWLESQGKCQRDSDGQPKRVVGVVADVTNRKLAEEAMLRAEKLAVAGRLAASVAHEINNPLEAVANLLYLIQTADTVESAQEQAGEALDELMRISQITLQTLKFHRQPGKPAVIKLSEVVQTVLTLFRGRLRATQIEVEVQAEREAGVECMPGEIQQIFANLVSNAIDAMPQNDSQNGNHNGNHSAPHCGRLTIRLRPSHDWRDSATPGMRVTFYDSGVGMDQATMRRIFEPFFTTKTETGTGLGMWVVAQLLARHNGHLRIWSTQSPRGSGTAFSVFLPLGYATPVDDMARVESRQG
jgi:PAS domain S-box-containing protein